MVRAAIGPTLMPTTPELSVRALSTGCALGALLAAGNVYMSLKTGWAETGNIMTAMLGFAICAGAGGRQNYTRLENNVTQVTAVAAGSMSYTAGLVALLPAPALLPPPRRSP